MLILSVLFIRIIFKFTIEQGLYIAGLSLLSQLVSNLQTLLGIVLLNSIYYNSLGTIIKFKHIIVLSYIDFEIITLFMFYLLISVCLNLIKNPNVLNFKNCI